MSTQSAHERKGCQAELRKATMQPVLHLSTSPAHLLDTRQQNPQAIRWTLKQKQGKTQCSAWADAVQCVGECSAVRGRMQCSPMVIARHCVGTITATNIRREQDKAIPPQSIVPATSMEARQRDFAPLGTTFRSTCFGISLIIIKFALAFWPKSHKIDQTN